MIDTVSGRRSTRPVPVLLLLLLLAACDVMGPADDPIVLVNGTELPLVPLVMELEQSYLVDPSPTLVLDVGDERILAPRESRRVLPEDMVGGFHGGQDLSILLYEVQGDTAVFMGLRVFGNPELVRLRYILRLP